MKYIIKTPQKYKKKKQELLDYFKKYSPIDLLNSFTCRKYKGSLIIQHKSLGKSAVFGRKNIYVDFENNINFLFLSICHELSHLLLRQKPAWYENKKIKKILDKHKDKVYTFTFQSKKYTQTFSYSIEQTLAILLHAACEQKAKIRKMDWNLWEKVFKVMGVNKFGKILFPEFKKYLKNIKKYKKIDDWILEMLEKYFNS